MDKTKVKKTRSAGQAKKETVKVLKPAVKSVVKPDKKMRKTIVGTVVSIKMEKTVVVAYTRKVAHKKYGKLLKVTKKIKADTNGMEISLGDTVKIEQTRPISKDKYFKVIKKEENK